MNKTTGLTAFLGMATAVMAPITSWADGVSYSYIEVNTIRIDPDNGGSENGWDINGNLALGETWYLTGRYGNVDLGGPDFERFSAGLGWHTAISESTDFLIEGRYERAEIGIFDENGYSAVIGLRSGVNEHFELGARVGYIDFGDDADGFTAGVNALFKINQTWGVNLAYETDEDIDVDVLSLGIRARF